jgi:hypothetical protein
VADGDAKNDEWGNWIDKGMKADPKEMDDLFHRAAA